MSFRNRFPKILVGLGSIVLLLIYNYNDVIKNRSSLPQPQLSTFNSANHSFADAMAAAVKLNTIAREQRLSQDDPKILNFLWKYRNVFLQQPRSNDRSTGYRGIDPSMGQTAIALKLLNYMENGFYIEVGGFDGLVSSNSFILEKRYGWNGILIEPDPSNLAKIFDIERNAWISRACASIRSYPQQVTFKPSKDVGRIVVNPAPTRDSTLISAQCFPLYSFLAALGIGTVDFWALDVEGFEFEILSTFPFDKVLVKLVTVEIFNSKIPEIAYVTLMGSKDFRLVSRIYEGKRLFDLMFLHNSIQVEQSVLDSVKEVHGKVRWTKPEEVRSPAS